MSNTPISLTSARKEFTYSGASLFNAESDGDIIARSLPSSIDFVAHKAFLSYASPVFRGMVSLPDKCDSVNMRDGRPIVPFTEDADTLEQLLKCCYPLSTGSAPSFRTVNTLVSSLVAAQKYCMDNVALKIREHFATSDLVIDAPLTAFALAYHHDLAPEMKVAARKSFRVSLIDEHRVPEFELITVGVYHALLQYHAQCRKAASAVAALDNLQWIRDKDYVWFNRRTYTCCKRHLSTFVRMRQDLGPALQWWGDFMKAAGEELQTKPSGNTVRMSSPFVVKMIASLTRAGVCERCEGLVLVQIGRFCESFAAEVEKVLDEIVLDVRLQT